MISTVLRVQRVVIYVVLTNCSILETLQSQYTRGPLRIATWAHLTNAHLLPGPSIVKALHVAAEETLTSMNQSVATTISTGTPRRSLETDRHDHHSKNVEESSLSAEASSDTFVQHGSDASQEPSLFSQAQNLRGTVSATTTISQTFEPISPPAHPSLVKSLSQGEEYQRDPNVALTGLGPPPHARGLLLLAEMSSEGNLITPEYTSTCVHAARDDREFVLGFICQHTLNSAPGDNFLNLTPGVSLPPEGEEEKVMGDGMGQRWRGPKEIIANDGADVVIVGRGILKAEDRRVAAQRYQQKAWEAYERRIGRSRP